MAWLKKKNLFVILAGALLVATMVFAFSVRPARGVLVEINGQEITAEVASTPEAQYRGLSGRAALCPDCGMLFMFADNQEHRFVMREMNFPLDILFIAGGKIINIASNLSPEGARPINIYASGRPVDMVLEVNGGYTASAGIVAGDAVRVTGY